MFSPEYRSIAMQSILGPAHSTLIPSVLWLGYLDAAGNLIAMVETPISHDSFGPNEDGVENIDPIDGGTAGESWVIDAVGLFADAEGTELIVSAELDLPAEPEEDEEITFDVGDLQFYIDYEPGGSSA
jgi:hypothetical protein